jgi:hypothetical protein
LNRHLPNRAKGEEPMFSDLEIEILAKLRHATSLAFQTEKLAAELSVPEKALRALGGELIGPFQCEIWPGSAGMPERIYFSKLVGQESDEFLLLQKYLDHPPDPAPSHAAISAEQSAAMLRLEIMKLDRQDAEFLVEARQQIDQMLRASRLQAMREDAPVPVSASIDPELSEQASNSASDSSAVAARAREFQAREKAAGRNISTIEAVNAVMPRSWRKKS